MEEKDYKYMVGVRCFTFNQSRYILDALNGFVMQQTNFPFVIMVVDDASTDGEQEVIAKFISEQFDTTDSSVAYEKETDYAHISYAQHKTNKNCYIAALYLKENHYSQRKTKMPYLSEWRDNVKYEALCEGDDYWIDINKLQKQVDIMETNTDATLCFHAHKTLHDKTGKTDEIHQYSFDILNVPKEDMILGGGGFMATNSMLYRIKAIDNYPQWTKYSLVGDAPLMLVLLHRGEVVYLNDVMSVYRQFAVGSWTSNSNSDYKIYKNNKYGTIKSLNGFDIWSEKKYHSIIKKKIRRVQIIYYKVCIYFILKKIGLK